MYQDVRGRYMSEGTLVEVRPHQDATGAKDDRREHRHLGHHRLARQAGALNNNGRVGMWGISYPGFYVRPA